MRRTLAVLALVVGLVAGAVACGSTATLGLVAGQRSAAPALQVRFTPADGATGVDPDAPVSLAASNGRLLAVTLTNAAGTIVSAAMSPDGHVWNTTEALGYGKTYTWQGSAVGADNRLVLVSGSFTTLTPQQVVGATLNIDDGSVVGIAAPIILQFDGHVADKVAVERALRVTTSPPTTGSWAWLPDDNGDSRVHWRPEDYWQPGTEVSVLANLYGLSYGDGSYGKEDLSTHFTIGRSQIVKADVTSHRLVVVRDGQVILDLPASYGLVSDPRRNTTNGIHVVMSKSQTVLMSNPAYGYVDVPEHWAVRISNNGEFIHANPETTGVQGSSNVTHGCVNLSTANAEAYYATAIYGDPVEVTNSPVPLSAADGDIYDWAVPWEAWQAMSALS